MDSPMIYKQITKIMAEVPVIGKDKKNQQQGFQYRGIDDVMNALFPLLCKYSVFVVPEVLETTREQRQTQRGGNLNYTISKVRYTFYAEDGSSVQAVVTGEGMDSADKSSNKALACAMKYALFQTFCIPTEEMAMDDPDRTTPTMETPSFPICEVCHSPIKATKTESADSVAARTKQKFGMAMCVHCAKAKAEESA